MNITILGKYLNAKLTLINVLVWGVDIFPIEHKKTPVIYHKNEDVFFVGGLDKIDENVFVLNILSSFIFIDVVGNEVYLGDVIVKVKEKIG